MKGVFYGAGIFLLVIFVCCGGVTVIGTAGGSKFGLAIRNSFKRGMDILSGENVGDAGAEGGGVDAPTHRGFPTIRVTDFGTPVPDKSVYFEAYFLLIVRNDGKAAQAAIEGMQEVLVNAPSWRKAILPAFERQKRSIKSKDDFEKIVKPYWETIYDKDKVLVETAVDVSWDAFKTTDKLGTPHRRAYERYLKAWRENRAD